MLAHVAGEELEHARGVLALAERDGDGGAQACVAGRAGARLLRVGAHVGDPRGAAEGEDAAGQAAAGGEAQAARALREGVDRRAGVGGDPGRAAAQRRPVALGQPDRAAREAERLAERAEHALHQALGALAVGKVVGDRLLGEQQPVRLALGAAPPRALELALQRLGDLAGPGRDGDARLEALDHGGEVVAAHGARDRDEREMRVGEAHERQRLARRHGGRALAAEQDGVPAAVEQRGLEPVAARRAARVHRPARGLERLRDLDRIGLGHVGEQDSE